MKKVLSFVLAILFIANVSFANDNLPTTAPDSYLKDVILQMIQNQEKVTIDLYVMSQCPAAIEVQGNLIPIIKELGTKADFQIHYIGSISKNGELNFLFQDAELRENLIQIAVLQNASDKYLTYIEERVTHKEMSSETILEKLKIDTRLILEKAISLQTKMDLVANVNSTLEKKIFSSPSLFINNVELDRQTLFAGCSSQYCCACVNGSGGSGPGSTNCGDLCASQSSNVAEEHIGVPGIRFCGGSCENTNTTGSCGNSCGAPACAEGEECQDCECMVVLPLDLISFDLNLIGDEVYLKWLTLNEENTLAFEIQKSADGKNWDKIGNVGAAGFSIEEQIYEFVDKKPSVSASYYRLKMIDLDNSFTYSPIRNLFIHAKRGVEIAPNPNKGSFNLSIYVPKEESLNVEIINAIGEVVYRKSYEELEKNQGNLNLDLDIPTGIYFCKISIGNQIVTKQIIIEK